MIWTLTWLFRLDELIFNSPDQLIGEFLKEFSADMEEVNRRGLLPLLKLLRQKQKANEDTEASQIFSFAHRTFQVFKVFFSWSAAKIPLKLFVRECLARRYSG